MRLALALVLVAAVGCTGETAAVLVEHEGPDGEAESGVDGSAGERDASDENSVDAHAGDAAPTTDDGPVEATPDGPPDAGTCGSPDACAPGASQHCNTYGVATCSAACAWGTCSCAGAPACVPGTLGCSGSRPQKCDSCGQWQDNGQPCPNVCSGGTCAGVCAPGSTQCTSATDVETCGTDGEWSGPVVCQFGCVGGGCAAQ